MSLYVSFFFVPFAPENGTIFKNPPKMAVAARK
jgi:hypothetical protein